VKLFAEHDNSESVAAAAAARHLFKVNDDAQSLAEQQMTICHNFVANCLFLTKQAVLDVATDVVFLSVQVKASDVNNWKKLTRMI
jgi:hypothetical protein